MSYSVDCAGVGLVLQKDSSPGGLEPPTFRLTAERANLLRHGDGIRNNLFQKFEKIFCLFFFLAPEVIRMKPVSTASDLW